MSTIFAFLSPGPGQVVIVAMVVLLLFGNRLPSVMRSLGEGITEFKKESRAVNPIRIVRSKTNQNLRSSSIGVWVSRKAIS